MPIINARLKNHIDEQPRQTLRERVSSPCTGQHKQVHSTPSSSSLEYTHTDISKTHHLREREIELPPIPVKKPRTHTRTTMPPINLQPKLQHPAPPTKNSIISYPAPGVLLVHLNKPKDLNCINAEFTQELENIWLWLDEEPTLSVGIITGTGRAFCAGADLKGR